MNIKNMIPKKIKNFYSEIYYYFFIKKNKYKVLTSTETIDKIVNDNVSVSRFGDGEFKWLLHIKQNSFQEDNLELSKRLKDILISDDSKILICIPDAFQKLVGYRKSTDLFWKEFIRRHGKQIKPYLNKNKIYGHTNFTRWYMEYEDKSDDIMKNRIKKLKEIWEDKEIIIVEGKDTKIGVGNDLLDNCRSIQRIICPSINAFNKYSEILDKCKEAENNKIFIIALGPTATVLAYDLARIGYQAIDIGHVDIEYEWFLRKTNEKLEIKGKYVNEIGKFDEQYKLLNYEYEKSIISYIEGDRDAN